MLDTYTLKKRPYINTTSMDAELSLLTANMACVGPRNLIYDPFIGTGGFALACAEFGALSWGSDIDGRVVRGEGGDGRAGAKQGKEKEKMDITTNFDFYGLRSHWLGGFVSDLTNTPLRPCRFLDAVVCDPPYGIREGLKVLGSKDEKLKEVVWLNGEAAHLYVRSTFLANSLDQTSRNPWYTTHLQRGHFVNDIQPDNHIIFPRNAPTRSPLSSPTSSTSQPPHW